MAAKLSSSVSAVSRTRDIQVCDCGVLSGCSVVCDVSIARGKLAPLLGLTAVGPLVTQPDGSLDLHQVLILLVKLQVGQLYVLSGLLNLSPELLYLSIFLLSLMLP